ILLGEKAMDPRCYNTGGWLWDDPIFAGGAGGAVRSGMEVVRDAVGMKFANNWGSAHAGGCQFVMVDGSIRVLPYGTPKSVMEPLFTPAGGEVVPPLDN